MSDGATPVGIRLHRFSRDNADLVLSWRNAAHVRANSLDDAEIAPDDHLAFVEGLRQRQDRHFFVLSLASRPEAVLNINVQGDQALWGCYLGGSQAPRPGLFPVLAAVSGCLAFDHFRCAALGSEVLSTNAAPQRLNAFLGVPMVGQRQHARPSGETVDVLQYRVVHAEWPAVRSAVDRVLTQAQRAMLAQFCARPASFIVD